ncbi:endonuclease domain-containing protein [Geodermatophilus sp. SYSU D00705]
MPTRRVRSRLTGPATRAGARAAGIRDWQLRHADVEPLSRDTYLPRALSNEMSARVAAVLLTSPPGTVASHATAAALWGLDIPLQDRADRRVDLTVPMTSRSESRRDRRVHRTPLPEDDTTRRGAVPVTTPERTWRDLAGVLQPAALLAVTDQLLGRWCTAAALEQQLRRRPGGRGSARAREVLPVADPLAESPMESVLRWLLHAAGLPSPVLQHVVRGVDGRPLARADLAWPDLRVIVEFDGDVHRERDVFVNDLRRQNRLVAAGWTVLRFTSADVLGRPHEVVAEIRRALRQ